MKIERLDIPWLKKGGGECAEDGLFHRKALPCFSAVQAIRGDYGVGIDCPRLSWTGEGGVFVAPPYRTQYIVHRLPAEGNMRMQWLFFDVTADGAPLEERMEFPLILPPAAARAAGEIMSEAREENSLCRNLSLAYALLDVLLPLGRERPAAGREREIARYVSEHYAEKLTPRRLADVLFVSEATLYRIFSSAFGQSPANYVNSVRLTQASRLLLTTDRTVTETALAVGFEDVYYFSRLFGKKFGQSPSRYRRSGVEK